MPRMWVQHPLQSDPQEPHAETRRSTVQVQLLPQDAERQSDPEDSREAAQGGVGLRVLPLRQCQGPIV